MEIQTIVRSQYHAALDMLQQSLECCPEAMWDDAQDKNRFWRVGYHALFYTHLYLQPSVGDFKPWRRHSPDLQDLGKPALSLEGQPLTPISKAELFEYLALCRQQVDEQVARLDPEAPSGFHWLPFKKLELQLYNIRHVQQHTGELMERLGTRAGIDVNWVGRKEL